MGIAGDTQAIMKQDECPKFKERPDSDEERRERQREEREEGERGKKHV